MIMLIYGSSSEVNFTEADLVEILEVAKKNNDTLGVTGILLYKDGNFLQVLEGEKDVVEALYNKVRKDPRHQAVMTIFVRKIEKRSFADWKMGFVNLDTLDPNDMPEGYSDFLRQPIDVDAFSADPSYASIFLEGFRDLVR